MDVLHNTAIAEAEEGRAHPLPDPAFPLLFLFQFPISQRWSPVSSSRAHQGRHVTYASFRFCHSVTENNISGQSPRPASSEQPGVKVLCPAADYPQMPCIQT